MNEQQQAIEGLARLTNHEGQAFLNEADKFRGCPCNLCALRVSQLSVIAAVCAATGLAAKGAKGFLNRFSDAMVQNAKVAQSMNGPFPPVMPTERRVFEGVGETKPGLPTEFVIPGIGRISVQMDDLPTPANTNGTCEPNCREPDRTFATAAPPACPPQPKPTMPPPTQRPTPKAPSNVPPRPGPSRPKSKKKPQRAA